MARRSSFIDPPSREGFDAIAEGQAVEFEVERGDKGPAPDFLWAWSPFGVHQEMWSQCLAIQAALLAPRTAWQTAWLQSCGPPAEALPNWFGAVVGGEPLP